MGVRLALGAVALTVVPVAPAGPPWSSTIARAEGVGSVTAGVSTSHVRLRVWIQRVSGVAPAHGTAHTSRGSACGTGQASTFPIALARGEHLTLWQADGSGAPCVVTVTLHANGRIGVVLRGD